ncbi:MAG: glutaredoxin family protein [Patescibacteria group bacterium]|jgi:glutaredoxin
MKITVYTIKDCAFSKQEKEYLNTNKLVFEEKDLETNKDFLTEMLAISNNFAGTPVTRVEKDDGSIAVLKGFTKSEFDTTFGFISPDEASAKAGPTDSSQPAVPSPVNDTPIPPVPEVPPAPVVTPVETPVAEPTNQVTDNQAADSPDPLKSVMDDLQAKAEPTVPPMAEPVVPPMPPAPPASETPPTTMPVDSNAPTIPDFPAK